MNLLTTVPTPNLTVALALALFGLFLAGLGCLFTGLARWLVALRNPNTRLP